MRRSMLGAMVGIAAAGLGVVAFARGQFWLGICFVLLGVLRLGSVWWMRKPRETEPEVRLNLDDSPQSRHPAGNPAASNPANDSSPR